MFYFAFVDENNVVTGVYAMPSDLSGIAGYIAITADQYNDPTLVGKVYDPETNTFNDPIVWACKTSDVQYKDTNKSLETKLDEMEEAIANAGSGSSVDAYTKTESDSRYATAEHTHTGFANATHTHTAADVSGVVKTINGTAPDESGNVSVSVSGGGMTAGEVLEAVKTVDGANSGLDADTLDGMEASAFATAEHTHTGYAAETHTHEGYASANDLAGKADANHTHDGYATADHTHTGYAAEGHTHTGYATEDALAGKADADHTHNDYITATTYANGMNGKADASHTHTPSSIGAASSSHTHTPASIGAAASSHTHSGYASSTHTHSGYLSTSGGTVSGDLAVTGVLKVGGQQAFYNSGTTQTIGTNNATGGTVIACGSSADVTVNGARMQIPSLLPRNGGSFQIGNTEKRFSGIYLTNSPNVSSDRRLKENISNIDECEAEKLIKNINVVNFNYIGKDEAQVGIIAQDIIELAPELAKALVEQGENGFYGVKTADLVFPLIATVQNLIAKVEDLEAKAE